VHGLRSDAVRFSTDTRPEAAQEHCDLRCKNSEQDDLQERTNHNRQRACGEQKLPARILMVSFDFKRDLQSKLIPFVSERIPALGCVLFSDSDTDTFIGSVDKEWSGSLPATLIIKQSGTCRTFMERQVSREELEQLVKSCIH
jgi:hypothetical protein